jgi:hypothetical protein
MAYLAKGFALPFFITHFTAMNLCRYYSTQEATGRKRVLSCFTFGMVTFFLFSSVWISLISIKEGRLIFNKAGAYTFALIENSWQVPIEHSGFMPPPDPIAMSIWDDSSLIPVESKALPDGPLQEEVAWKQDFSDIGNHGLIYVRVSSFLNHEKIHLSEHISSFFFRKLFSLSA